MPRLLLTCFFLLPALLIGGCGGDDEPAGGSGRSGDSAPATDDGGTGYAIAVPDGWREATKEFEGSAIKIDKAWAAKPKDDFATNILVIRETPGEVSLDQVMEQFEGQAESLADDAGIGEIEKTKLGGEEARTYAYKLDRKEPPQIRQRQVVAVKDDAVYTITFSALADSFDQEETAFDSFRESWTWK